MISMGYVKWLTTAEALGLGRVPPTNGRAAENVPGVRA
jgi:hypothetical protein